MESSNSNFPEKKTVMVADDHRANMKFLNDYRRTKSIAQAIRDIIKVIPKLSLATVNKIASSYKRQRYNKYAPHYGEQAATRNLRHMKNWTHGMTPLGFFGAKSHGCLNKDCPDCPDLATWNEQYQEIICGKVKPSEVASESPSPSEAPTISNYTQEIIARFPEYCTDYLKETKIQLRTIIGKYSIISLARRYYGLRKNFRERT